MLLLTDLTSASIGIEYCQKNKWKSVAATHIDTAYKKYRWRLHQYSKSIAATIGHTTNIAILTTLWKSKVTVTFKDKLSILKFIVSLVWYFKSSVFALNLR